MNDTLDMRDFEVVPAGTIEALRNWMKARDAYQKGGVDSDDEMTRHRALRDAEDKISEQAKRINDDRSDG